MKHRLTKYDTGHTYEGGKYLYRHDVHENGEWVRQGELLAYSIQHAKAQICARTENELEWDDAD